MEAYSWIMEEEPNEVSNIGKEGARGRYANDVDVTAGKKEKMNVYEYCYEKPDGKESCFEWITDIVLTKKTGRNDRGRKGQVEDRERRI